MSLDPQPTARQLRALAKARAVAPRQASTRGRSATAKATKGRKAAHVPTEHEEQAELFRWAESAKATHPSLGLLFAIPNAGGYKGGFTSNVRLVMRAKREGVRNGVPDVMLPVPRGGLNGLFIEMKRTKGGTTSAEQRAWLAALQAHGYHAVRCNGWRDARVVILDYLHLRAPAAPGSGE